MNETSAIPPRQQLPTARIAFPQQLNILRAYAAASGATHKAVGNDEVADIVQLSKTTVPLANPFFSSVGLIEKTEGKRYIPAEEVFKFFEVYAWGSEHEEKAAHELAPLIRETWFAKALLPKVAFGSISTSEALQTLARAAGVQPDNRQLRMLLEFLTATGLIEVNGDQIQGDRSQPSKGTAPETPAEVPTPETAATPAPPPASSHDNLPMLVQGLIDKLPDESDGWNAGAAKRWLNLAEATFPMAYDYDAADNAPNGGDPRDLASPHPAGGGDVP
jgi:hypothetical protein